jgi:hypothetical protein
MESKKVAIVQSNYIPWKGYFDLINMVDEFILYDDMQFTKRDWRNRNRIKTPNGLQWLTIPVDVKGKYYQKINETKVSDSKWMNKHWYSIVHSYSKAKYFKEVNEIFEETYLNCKEIFLSSINITFINLINNILDIKTKIRLSSEFNLCEGKTERLLHICNQTNATEYISGPSAKSYLDETLFTNNNIKISWMDYSNYSEYKQLYPPFEHSVSIIDLIFNEGHNSKNFLKSKKMPLPNLNS